jgi:hypothetical protein
MVKAGRTLKLVAICPSEMLLAFQALDGILLQETVLFTVINFYLTVIKYYIIKDQRSQHCGQQFCLVFKTQTECWLP